MGGSRTHPSDVPNFFSFLFQRRKTGIPHKHYGKSADFAAAAGSGWRGVGGYPVPNCKAAEELARGVGVPGQTPSARGYVLIRDAII